MNPAVTKASRPLSTLASVSALNGNGAWGVKPFGFVFGRDEDLLSA